MYLIKAVFGSFMEFFYPKRCEGCGKRLPVKGQKFCTSCKKRLEGKPICYILKGKSFDVAIAPFQFGDPVAGTVMNYKETGSSFRTAIYARYMREAMELYSLDFDLVTWVPMHVLKRMKRGFDHSEKIAEKVAKLYQKKAVSLLRKTKLTAPQRGMSLRMREANVINTYEVKKRTRSEIVGRRILVVDDVLTTGSTMETVSRELLFAGAASVVCATVATGKFSKTLSVENGENGATP